MVESSILKLCTTKYIKYIIYMVKSSIFKLRTTKYTKYITIYTVKKQYF